MLILLVPLSQRVYHRPSISQTSFIPSLTHQSTQLPSSLNLTYSIDLIPLPLLCLSPGSLFFLLEYKSYNWSPWLYSDCGHLTKTRVIFLKCSFERNILFPCIFLPTWYFPWAPTTWPILTTLIPSATTQQLSSLTCNSFCVWSCLLPPMLLQYLDPYIASWSF